MILECFNLLSLFTDPRSLCHLRPENLPLRTQGLPPWMGTLSGCTLALT